MQRHTETSLRRTYFRTHRGLLARDNRERQKRSTRHEERRQAEPNSRHEKDDDGAKSRLAQSTATEETEEENARAGLGCSGLADAWQTPQAKYQGAPEGES